MKLSENLEKMSLALKKIRGTFEKSNGAYEKINGVSEKIMKLDFGRFFYLIRESFEKLIIEIKKRRISLSSFMSGIKYLKIKMVLFMSVLIFIIGMFIPARTVKVLFCGNMEILSNLPKVLSPKELKVHFIDCGQGDAVFIEYRDFTMLVDAGPEDSAYKVMSYVRSLTEKLDFHIVTHGHDDHGGGSRRILTDIDTSAVIIPPVDDGNIITGIKALALEKNIPLCVYKKGDSIEYGDLKIKFLAPALQKYENLNNSSIVISVSLGETDFLLTGDRELSGDILPPLKCEVIKAPHHGSDNATDSLFLKTHSPSLYVISCGLNNKFSHPSKSVINLLDKTGTMYLRTDLQGTAVVVTDGKVIEYSTID